MVEKSPTAETMSNAHLSSETDVLELEPTSSAPRHHCPLRKKPPVVIDSRFSLAHDWKMELFPELADGIASWEARLPTDNLFTSAAYLELLDELQLGGVRNGLAIFHHPEKGCFGLILQVFSFSARAQLGNLATEKEGKGWQKISESVRRGVANWLNFRVLNAGQLLFTGEEHGLAGLSHCDIAATSTLCQLIEEGLELAANHWPERIHGIVLKDLPLADTPRRHGYHPLPVQPNMVLPISEEWSSFEDYLAAMSSKYRVRVRRARKKGKILRTRILNQEDLNYYEEQMYSLFRKIADQSEFNAVQLPPHYFRAWAEAFPEQVEIIGYFEEDTLIGFTTTIQNGHELEAHYLGLDAAYNPSHQLYLNMLYDMVEKAIALGVDKLVLSRTALEIKSSIGAVPQELPCWLRGRKRWSTALIPFIAPYVAPPMEWQQRHPFK